MRFAEPLGFLVLLLVPLVFIGHFLHQRRVESRLRKAGDPDLIGEMTALGADHGQSARLFAATCFAAALAFVAIAIARPQFGLRTEVRKGRGMDLVLALDLSRSMLARDVVPARLERARAELSVLIKSLAGDRIGLVGFTSVAIPLCPLTVDHAALELQLRAATPADMPRGGTSVGQAIEAARRMLESSPRDGGGKAIVIITDGEEHQGNAQLAAAEAKKAGVEVHIAGVGSRTGEPIPLVDANGGVTGYLKDARGQTVVTRLNEAALRAIATAGGGLTALPGASGGLDLTPVRLHLARLKKAELEERTVRVFEERYRWALIPGLLLLMIATLVRPRRTRPRIRLRGAKALLTSLMCLPALLLLGAGPFETEDSDVRDGNAAMADGRSEDAVAAYDRAGVRLAADPRLAFNRGLAQAAAGEIDAAIEDLKSAIAAAEDPSVRSQTNLALGNALRKKKQLKEAAQAYQQALLDDPGNAAARRNLEIARAMKRIQDLQPKEENPDGEPSEGDGDKDDEDKEDQQQQDGGTGDGGKSQDQPEQQESRDGGVSEAGQPQQPETPDGGTGDGQDGGEDGGGASQGQMADAGPEDGGQQDAGAPATALNQQDVQQLLDALQEREQVLKRKRLIQKYGNKKVEKDW